MLRTLFGSRTPPPGLIRVAITYLGMDRPPARPARRAPRADGLDIVRAVRPTVPFYRFLHNAVGERWLWWDRRKLDDQELRLIIQDPRNAVHVLYVEGVPAGYAELERLTTGEINLAYFGLMPEFIGAGLGPWFLDWAIAEAWHHQPLRLIVNTCTLDHPAALPMYQKAGFVPYRREEVDAVDPRRDPRWERHRV